MPGALQGSPAYSLHTGSAQGLPPASDWEMKDPSGKWQAGMAAAPRDSFGPPALNVMEPRLHERR